MRKLQDRLIQNILLISTLPLIILAIVTFLFLNHMAVSDADEKIKNNLNIALSLYQNTCDELKYLLKDQNRKVDALLWSNQLGQLRKELKEFSDKNDLDFFVVTDKNGKIIISISNPFSVGVDLSNDEFVQRALNNKEIIISTEAISEPELRRLELIKKAKITGCKEPIKGMVIKVVIPIIGGNGSEAVSGAMVAGILLNNNKVIIDKIKATTKYATSIFLNKMRITTNLPYPLGKFALGCNIDPRVEKSIFRSGENYIGRIWIVNEWFRVGYLPLYNYAKNIVGILAIGIPEREIFVLRNSLVTIFAIAVFVSIILAFMLGVLKGGQLVNNITALRNGIRAFVQGDYSHRLEINSGDEVEELGIFFNQTMAQLKEAEGQVVESAERLGILEQQLHSYEKMALIGRMATIINHELRNAFARIQVSASCLKEIGGEYSSQFSECLRDIDNSLNYASEVLAKLLKYSHPRKLIFSEVDLNFVIEDVMSSMGVTAMLKNTNIKVIKKLDLPLSKINADAIQLREVFFNLVTNAIQAMPEGGKLELVSKKEKDLIHIEIINTGDKVPEEIVKNVCSPFLTTKSKGIGLGLCICKDIVEAHKGSIRVNVAEGLTRFIVEFPGV